MAKRGNLNCLEKRDLLNRTAASASELVERGQHYEEAGMVHDATDFYEKANARDALHRLMKRSVEEGDVFLFKRISRILNHEPSRDEWLHIARQSEKAGKGTFASEAYHRAGTETSLEDLSSSSSS